MNRYILYSVILTAVHFNVAAGDYIISDYSTDTKTTMGQFSPSDAYEEFILSSSSEDLLSFNNYAEVVLESANSGSVSIIQTNSLSGPSNRAVVIQKYTFDNSAYLSQDGSANIAFIEQSYGDNNIAYLVQVGYGHEGFIAQSGSNNLAYLEQYDNNGPSSISIDQAGNNNEAMIIDYGGSHYGITQYGDNHGISIVSSLKAGIVITQQ